MKHFLRTGLALVGLAVAIAGCSPIVDARGHGIDPNDLKQLVVGQSRDEDVYALFGSPSARSDYSTNTWYYITERKETLGPFPSELTEQNVTAITFDADHVVRSIEDYTKDKGVPVVIVDKTTPTEGHELGAMEQLLGNVGRFNAPGRGISPRDLGR